MNYLCKTFGRLPTDPVIADMDSFTWRYFYEHWLEDKNEEIKLLKTFGCFVGSFYNPEAAKRLQEGKESDISLSDEEFDAASEYVKNFNKMQEMEKNKRKIKRKLKL